jgi:hypothetical protein
MEAAGGGGDGLWDRGRRLGLCPAGAGTRVLRAADLQGAGRTAAIYERHGITNVGYWIPVETDAEQGIDAGDTFIYIRGYPSKAERDKRLKAAHDDPEFAEVVTKQERDPNTKLIIKAHNIDMVPSGSYTAIKIAP